MNPADSKLLAIVREEPWYKLAHEEFESIGEETIDSSDFTAILTRMFEKKKVPIPSSQTLECMFTTFDTNGDSKLSKLEFLCGLWRVLAFADAAAAICDGEDDEQGGEWEGDYMQYLRLAVVPYSQNTMLSVNRLHEMFSNMLAMQCTEHETKWRPSSTLRLLFERHKDILDGLEKIDYDIDEEHQHIMQVITQPGKTVDWESMQAKISSCSFGLAFEMMFKGLGTKEEVNVEIPFAQVCASECPVTTVMDHFFQPNVPEISANTYLIRQAMRDYLGSEDMLRPTDRSFLLRLKNARSASRATLSVAPSHSRPTFQPSSPPIASQLSPRFEAQQMPELPASKRPYHGLSSTTPECHVKDIAQHRFSVAEPPRRSQEDNDSEDEDEDDEEEEDTDNDGNDDDNEDNEDNEDDDDVE